MGRRNNNAAVKTKQAAKPAAPLLVVGSPSAPAAPAKQETVLLPEAGSGGATPGTHEISGTRDFTPGTHEEAGTHVIASNEPLAPHQPDGDQPLQELSESIESLLEGDSEGDDEKEIITGTSRITDAHGKLKLPDPHVEVEGDDERDIQAGPKAEAKRPDPNKPKDVVVTAQHIIKTFARTTAQNRMTRLTELARRNNDVQWLLAEYRSQLAAAENALSNATRKTDL